jgi:hypothetical protein
MTSQSIRDAVHDGDYVRAAELFVEWTLQLPPGETALAELAELARWTRTEVACAQAHSQSHLQALRDESHASSAYSQ